MSQKLMESREFLSELDRNKRPRKMNRREMDQRYVESVMFVPYTPKSELKGALASMESKGVSSRGIDTWRSQAEPWAS